MVSQEIRNCGIALGALMHQVNEEQAAMLRLIKTNLVAAADHAEELEQSLIVPKPEQDQVKDRAQANQVREEEIQKVAV